MALKKGSDNTEAAVEAAAAEAQGAATGVVDMTGMTFELNVSDVPPTVVLPEGDYRLRVDKIEYKQPEKKPNKQRYWYFNVRCSAIEHPTAEDIFLMVPYPTPDDDEKTKMRKMRELKQFLDAVGIDTSSGAWNPLEATGREFDARLMQKTNPETKKIRNEVADIIGAA